MTSHKTSHIQHDSPKRTGLLVPSLLGKDYVKQPRWHTLRNSLLPIFGNSISKQVPPKTAHALAVWRLSWIVWNDKSSMQPKKVWKQPFQEITNNLQPQIIDVTNRNILAEEGYHWHIACKVPYLTKVQKTKWVHWTHLYKDYMLRIWEDVIWSDKSYVYLTMIEGECMLHAAQTKNMMRTVWYQCSSSLLFVLWYGDVLWRGGKVHWLCWNIWEGREVGWTWHATRSRCWIGFWGIFSWKWSQRSPS